MNIYLIDSDEDDIVDFVKDHEEFYNKINDYCKDKPRKDCLWERLASSRNLLIKVCKTWFKSQRNHYGKVTQYMSGQVPKEMIER